MLIPDSHRQRKRTARDKDLNSRLANEEERSKTGFHLDTQGCIWMTMILGINGALGWLSWVADGRPVLENCILKGWGRVRSRRCCCIRSQARRVSFSLGILRSPSFHQGTFKPIKQWLPGSEGLLRAPVTMAAYAGHHHRSNLRGKLQTLPSDLQQYL